MRVYRIASKAFIYDLSGRGAMVFGGRWNKKGLSMLYTSQSVSLAALEMLANLSLNKFKKDLYYAEIEFSDSFPISEVKDLPDQWNAFPHKSSTVRIGSDFLTEDGFCLKVPSAIVPLEHNYLLNPAHNHFKTVKVIDAMPFIIDNRLTAIKNL
ncbi:MAG: RES family NAD+ phosphorylase [Bacteroidota bacterium]